MRRAVLAAALLLALPLAGYGQCPPPLVPPDAAGPCLERYPSWAGELAVLGGNAFLGGISAGVVHRLRGGSFSDAFVRGIGGGAVVYGGKRIASERFGGAGLVGRQVAAVGSSMVHNAAAGRGPVEQLMLPVGPLWLQLQAEAPRVSARLDIVSAGWLIAGVLHPELKFDAGMSISSGAHVFVASDRIIATTDTLHAHGITEPGFIAMGDVPAFGRHVSRQVFQHERVHVLQMDQVFLQTTRPAEQRLFREVPGLRRLSRYVELNLSGALLGLLGAGIDDFLDRPWETEAIFLSR
jgi:hypothetical protein